MTLGESKSELIKKTENAGLIRLKNKTPKKKNKKTSLTASLTKQEIELIPTKRRPGLTVVGFPATLQCIQKVVRPFWVFFFFTFYVAC